MPHADHFLSRLDRVSSREVELALTLYNDPALVAAVLAAARAPDEAHRVALPLAGGEAPPHVVVTREGRFVTCLGAGMRPHSLFVVPRATLEAVCARLEATRVAVATLREVRREGSARQLMGRIFTSGPLLAREEMRSLVAMAPLIGRELLDTRVRVAGEVAHERLRLSNLMSRVDKIKEREFAGFERFWLRSWATAHLALLAAVGAPGLHADLLATGPEVSITLDLTGSGLAGMALRGAWVNARLGRAALPRLKQAYARADTFADLADAALGLIAVALRHTRTRGEVEKALAPGRLADAEYRPLATYFVDVMRWTFEAPEEADEAVRRGGAEAQVALSARLPVGSPWRFDRAEEVPLGIALGHLLRSRLDFLRDRRNIASLLTTLRAAVRQRPEDLYLPAAVVDAMGRFDLVDEAIAALQTWREVAVHERAEAAKRRPEGPARQGPCPCGSGKKYKRCCEGKPAPAG